ncbi:MAG: hypothetical protein FAF04_04015 [Epsilonproteobacteria bacterium]|nr:hypothetical protein [Campylobacterota bacterium]
MQVAKYTFQSPYPNPVQVRRLDPSSLKEDSTNSNQSNPAALTNETEQKAKNLESSLKQEVKPTLSTNKIDIYV